MVAGSLGYSLILNLQDSKNVASRKVTAAIEQIGADFRQIQINNEELAQHLAHDQNFLNAYSAGDRTALANCIRTAIDQRSLSSFVTLIDEHGRIFFSSDTPAKFGFDAEDRSSGVEQVFRNTVKYLGPASFTPTGVITISSMIPLSVSAGRLSGVVIASQPIDSEFLIGEVTKLAILPDPIAGIDMALLNGRDGNLIQVTPGLANENSPFIASLREQGIKALPNSFLDKISNWFAGLANDLGTFDRNGRCWRQVNLEGVRNQATGAPELVGVLLLSAALPNTTGKIVTNLYLYATTGALALFAALLLAAWLSKNIHAPLKILTQRVNDIAGQNTSLPPNEGLSGDWKELSEKIDNTLVSMRSTIQGLKGQLSKLAPSETNKQQSDRTDSQFDALNRQVSAQSKQLTELSKQINYSSRQSVALQQRLDAVMQSSTEGFLILDQFGNVLSANAVLLTWMGLNEGEIAGKYCFDLVKKPGEPQSSDSAGGAFSKHASQPQDLINEFFPEGVIYNKRTDKATEVLAHLQPVGGADSQIDGYILVLRDKALRSEVAQLKVDIVTMLSESIRNPLIEAEANWQSILHNAPQSIQPAVGQALADLHSKYDTLASVIDSLLMIHSGAVPPPAVPTENFPITRLVADCLGDMAPQAREHQLSLDSKSVTGLPNITGNREAIRGVLMQILEKMIAHTAPGGRVRVETIVKGSEMQLGVLSSGPALPESEITDMFVGFIPNKHSEDSYSSRLSMYLARNNIERMGGKIWAESEAGRGTVIHFTLPLS